MLSHTLQRRLNRRQGRMAVSQPPALSFSAGHSSDRGEAVGAVPSGNSCVVPSCHWHEESSISFPISRSFSAEPATDQDEVVGGFLCFHAAASGICA